MARLRSRVPTSLSVRNVQAIPRAGLALSSLGVLKKGSHRGGAGADLQYRRLIATLAEYNRHARNGEDPAFGRGTTLFNRRSGDSDHKPNPCVAPIEKA